MTPLIGPSDPTPVAVVNTDASGPLLLLCEHAGRAIPTSLGDLGVSETDRVSHIGWDIGAEALARALSARLGATLILQNYSRLVVDCNRPPHSQFAIPERSAGIAVPGNAGLTKAERQARLDGVFEPMNRMIECALDACPRHMAISIHSFTEWLGGRHRPWHAGFLARADLGTANALMAHISARRSDLRLALNEPYQIEDETDWFIPAYAEKRNLRHCLVEVRNDQLRDDAGIATWTDLLATAIQSAMDNKT